MKRRDAIHRIAATLGGAISAPTLTGLLAGCRVESSTTRYTPRSLSPVQFSLVRSIAERIIPETETPGATAARVDVFVDMMLTDFYSVSPRTAFLKTLDEVGAQTRSSFGVEFADASIDEQDAFLVALDTAAYPDRETEPEAYDEVRQRMAEGDPPFFRVMKELTIAGYYTSEIGQTIELHLPPYGEYQPDVALQDIGRSWA